MKQASYQELQDLVGILNKENQALKTDISLATERIEYWQDIATKQNDCILMQSDRYDVLETRYVELQASSKVPTKPLETQLTEMSAKNKRWEKRCTNLDDRLADYEDSYKSLRKKKEAQDIKLDNAKETIEQLGSYIQKEEAMTSLLLQELKKYKLQRIDVVRPRRTPKRIPCPVEENIVSITKTVKINIDRMGHYSVSKN